MTESAARPQVRTAPVHLADPYSAMAPRFNLFFRWFAHRFFRHLDLDTGAVARLEDLESRGSVVYVMRYASRLDYFLFNTLFRRRGLRLSGFANGVRFYYYRPLHQALALALRRLRARGFSRRSEARSAEHKAGRECVRKLVASGESLFVFLRTARLSSLLLGRRHVVGVAKHELEFLEELVESVSEEDHPVFLVPLALFWRKGPRSERRFLNLAYGASTRPTDLAKVTSFLITYRGLSVRVGEAIDLRAFVRERRSEGRQVILRKVRRSLLLYFYREEKVVEGPTIRALHRVQEAILGGPQFEQTLTEYARNAGISIEAARARAEKDLREIAARMNSTFLAALSAVLTAIFKRVFVGIEVTGLDRIADYAKRYPLVLVPSHRSYFDFLILSWLFYANHLVPPHVAARENMAFGPFGFLFRRVGAFFLRRAFDDSLYKEVFRRYIGHLVREGFTQEFFIEGGRSRTGKSQAPRLGMLSWDVEAFLESARRDLFFVPIAITYERLVEEGALIRELEGGKKRDESVLGLVRARKLLRKRFGTVFVNFGEPISLATALGDRREEFAHAADPLALEQKRHFIERLGNRIVERINWATVANATSVAACAMLGESRRGVFRSELVLRMQEVIDLLRIQDVRITPALERDEGDFRESIAFLLRSDLLKSDQDPRGEILYYDEDRRRALDIYRNAILHYLATPSFVALALLRGGSADALRSEVADWLDLLYAEFFAPREELLAAYVEGFLDHFERFGLVERKDGELHASEKGRSYFRFLATQTRGVIEGYYATCSAVLDAGEEPLARKALEKRVAEQFDRAHLLGEVQCAEARNPVTIGNALELLVRLSILERTTPPGDREGRREPVYARGPAFEAVRPLHGRLASALAAR